MSKILSKFLDTYNLLTLRDVETASLGEENILVYDIATQKFKNQAIQVFGKDAAAKRRQAQVDVTGSVFVLYDSLTFNVSEVSGVNEYRVNADFFWNHNSASNDIRVQFRLDGNIIGEEFRVEPKDPNADQRPQNNILDYVTNLTQGNHLLEIYFRPATASRISRMYKSVIEVWRTK